MPKQRLTKKEKRARGCTYIVVAAFVCVSAVVGLFRPKTNTTRDVPRPTIVESTITREAQGRATEEASFTPTEASGRSLQDEATKGPDTAVPAGTSVPPVATSIPVQEESAVDVIDISARIYYTQGAVNVRTCAATSCEVVTRLNGATAVSVNGQATGEAVNAGNNVWYRVDIDGTEGYIYSGLLANTPVNNTSNDSSNTGNVSQPPAATSAPQFVCPSNCTEAVDRGVSAQQAAACGLDRDGDGVACYGD